MTDGLRINDNEIKDLIFGTEADLAIGRLVASFGPATQDTGWQTSTGQYGVCASDLERIVIFDTLAIEGKASPRKPKVSMPNRSSKLRSLEVA